ncbi:putative chloride channel, voltage gated, chloride channel, core [Helianthus anomalus]
MPFLLKTYDFCEGCNVDQATCVVVLYAYISPQLVPVGILEVKAYLNGVDAHSILAPSTLFVKIFGSILGVAAGFVVGKEGPMVHTGLGVIGGVFGSIYNYLVDKVLSQVIILCFIFLEHKKYFYLKVTKLIWR